MIKTSTKFVTAIALLFLTACSGVNREAALELANTGQTASSALLHNVQKIRTDFADGQRINVVADYLVESDTPDTDPNDLFGDPAENMKAEREIIDILKSRETLLVKLSAAYTDFHNLSRDDVTTPVSANLAGLQTAVNSFVDTANNYETEGKKISKIDDGLFQLVGEGLNIAAEESEKRAILNANNALLVAVTKVKEVYDAQRKSLQRLSKHNKINRITLIRTLHEKGLLKIDNHIVDIIELVTPLNDSEKKAAIAKVTPTMHPAILAYLRYDAELDVADALVQLDQHLTAMDSLIIAHRALQSHDQNSTKVVFANASRILSSVAKFRTTSEGSEQ